MSLLHLLKSNLEIISRYIYYFQLEGGSSSLPIPLKFPHSPSTLFASTKLGLILISKKSGNQEFRMTSVPVGRRTYKINQTLYKAAETSYLLVFFVLRWNF